MIIEGSSQQNYYCGENAAPSAQGCGMEPCFGMSDGGNFYCGGCGGPHPFCHPTPSPADSGVMSPMTPMSSGAASTSCVNAMTSPEHGSSSLTTACYNPPSAAPSSSSACSPYNGGQPSPADSGFNCGLATSPFPMASPGGACDERSRLESNCLSWQQQPPQSEHHHFHLPVSFNEPTMLGNKGYRMNLVLEAIVIKEVKWCNRVIESDLMRPHRAHFLEMVLPSSVSLPRRVQRTRWENTKRLG